MVGGSRSDWACVRFLGQSIDDTSVVGAKAIVAERWILKLGIKHAAVHSIIHTMIDKVIKVQTIIMCGACWLMGGIEGDVMEVVLFKLIVLNAGLSSKSVGFCRFEGEARIKRVVRVYLAQISCLSPVSILALA